MGDKNLNIFSFIFVVVWGFSGSFLIWHFYKDLDKILINKCMHWASS